jgi:hypothetical protein
MCASIREFGFKIPCLVRSDGEVIDGHLRNLLWRPMEVVRKLLDGKNVPASGGG